MLRFVDMLFNYLFPDTPAIFAGLPKHQGTGQEHQRDWFKRERRRHWFNGSLISPSVRRPPAAPSSSNTAPSFEPEQIEEVEVGEEL